MENELLNRQKALEMVDNDEELLNILFNAFIETEFDINKLISLINEKKYDEAASYTHRVKGAGRQIAAERIARSGQDLEDVLRRKKTGDIKNLVNTFHQDYKATLSLLKTLV